ncbi:MAG: hypothetical protein J0I11_07655 [Actinobacteria bacterium]|nr:hypothetical protein [Actinomycetota bacterium]
MTAPRRPVPAAAAALVLAISAVAVALVAIIASRAGPLVAHPPTAEPRVPQPIEAPTLPTVTMTTFPPQQQEPPSGDWLWWIAAVLAGLIVIALVAWLVRALRRPARIAPHLGGVAPAAAVDAVLGSIADTPPVDIGDERTFDPERSADDIIATWVAVEKVAVILGHRRRSASTPTEFLRALTEEFGDPAFDDPAFGGSAADVLLGLYHRARFDTAALAPGAATAARVAARTLLATWDRTERPRPGAHR